MAEWVSDVRCNRIASGRWQSDWKCNQWHFRLVHPGQTCCQENRRAADTTPFLLLAMNEPLSQRCRTQVFQLIGPHMSKPIWPLRSINYWKGKYSTSGCMPKQAPSRVPRFPALDVFGARCHQDLISTWWMAGSEPCFRCSPLLSLTHHHRGKKTEVINIWWKKIEERGICWANGFVLYVWMDWSGHWYHWLAIRRLWGSAMRSQVLVHGEIDGLTIWYSRQASPVCHLLIKVSLECATSVAH